MGNQMEYSDADQSIANWHASLASLPEERGAELKASIPPNDCVIETAFTKDIQAVIPRTAELGKRCYRANWNSVRAVVSMITIKVSIKQGPRPAKRQRQG